MKLKRKFLGIVILGIMSINLIVAMAGDKVYQYESTTVTVSTYTDYLSRIGKDRVYYNAHQYGKDADATNTPIIIYTYDGKKTKIKDTIIDDDLKLGHQYIRTWDGIKVKDADGITIRILIEGEYYYNSTSK